MTQLRIWLLGAPLVEVAGEPMSTDRRKAVALLAYLAVSRQTHSRESLATLFWPDSDQSRALAYLRRTLWELNNTLGEEWLLVDREQVSVNPQADIWLDAAEFGARAESEDPADLAAAVGLYRGEFMSGFTLQDSPGFDDWQAFQAEALRLELGDILERLVTAYAEQGSWEAATEQARRWVTLDPLYEPAHQQLMRIYAWQGRRAAALRQYEQCVALLAEELGVEPLPETKALQEAIAAGELAPPEEPVQLAPQTVPRAAENGQHADGQYIYHLPSPPTPFVGRDPELEALHRLVEDPSVRLLTLIGPGGTGKSRLAIEAAARQARHFENGVCFVPLAPLERDESIVGAIANALDFSFYKKDESPRDQLLEFLREKHLLLVLDNYEHLLTPESVQLPRSILAAADGVKIITTSRTRLNVQGEQLYHVAGMRTPEAVAISQENGDFDVAQFSALQLFRERARRVRPDFELTAETLPAVVRICQLVQGMPLGIELAAAWMELLSPEQIVAEIERSLDFLETEQHDVPDRQRSVRAVFETSWTLLTPDERDVFLRLTVFRGGFTHEAAGAVAGASLRTLLGLVNKSWLQRDGESRFGLHELLRQYAAQILSEDVAALEETRATHAEYYSRWLVEQGRRMRGHGQMNAVAAVQADYENVRTAWSWLLQQQHFGAEIEEMLTALGLYGYLRFAWDEILPLAQEALERLPINQRETLLHGVILTAVTLCVWETWNVRIIQENLEHAWNLRQQNADVAPQEMGFWYPVLLQQYGWATDRELGIALLREYLATPIAHREAWTRAMTLYYMAHLLSSVHSLEQAHAAFDEAVKIFQELGDAVDEAYALEGLSMVVRMRGDLEGALKLMEEVRELLSARGNKASLGTIAWNMAELNVQIGRFNEAADHYREQHEIFRSIGNQRAALESLHWLGLITARYGDLDEALQIRAEHLKLTERPGFETNHGWALWEMGELRRLNHEPDVARTYFEQSKRILSEYAHVLGVGFYHRGTAELALAAGDYERARAEYQRYLEAARQELYHWSIAYALSGLGRASTGLEEYRAAEQYFHESLETVLKEGVRDLGMLPLTGLAELLLKREKPAAALELASFVTLHFLTWNHTRSDAAQVMLAAREQLPPEEVTAAEHQGAKWEFAEVVEAVLRGDYAV